MSAFSLHILEAIIFLLAYLDAMPSCHIELKQKKWQTILKYILENKPYVRDIFKGKRF